MVELTSDERAKVEAARLTPRPNYFNASASQETPISEDFEAFLILQDPVTLSAAVAWLATAGLLGNLTLDRDAVALEAVVTDQADVSDTLSEIQLTTAAFNAWRAAWNAGKFSDTPEVQLVIRDMLAPAEEVFIQEERLKHLSIVQDRVLARLRQSVDPAQLRELQSWAVPLLSY